MRMKSVFIASAMMATGMVSIASAGVDGPPTDVFVYCGDLPTEVCLDGDLVEVELTCKSPETLVPTALSGLYVGPGLPTFGSDWNLNIVLGPVEGNVPEPFLICGGTGPHVLRKTEGECTDQQGPTKGNKKHPGGFDGYAVQYRLETIEEDAELCVPEPCPCWEPDELLSITATNQYDGYSCGDDPQYGHLYPDAAVIQNDLDPTEGVKNGFLAATDVITGPNGEYSPPVCLTRDPRSRLTITNEEATACIEQIAARCAAIGSPIPGADN